MSELVPVTKALDCGVVECAQRSALVKVGSRLGIADPVWVTRLEPTVTVVAVLACDAAFPLMPVCAAVPVVVLALVGPAVTLVDTPRANPPASARWTLASASCGPYR